MWPAMVMSAKVHVLIGDQFSAGIHLAHLPNDRTTKGDRWTIDKQQAS